MRTNEVKNMEKLDNSNYKDFIKKSLKNKILMQPMK